MIEVIYKSRNNRVVGEFYFDGVPANFSPVTRMTLLAGGVLLDSNDDPQLIDWSLGNGKVGFKIGQSAVPLGLHQCTLVAFDPNHPDGQVIAHPAGPKLSFRVVR